jgi:hypothetical protein
MKGRQLNVRVTPEERLRIEARAQAEGVRVATWVRQIVVDALSAPDVANLTGQSASVTLPVAGSLRIALETLSRRVGVSVAEVALRAVDAGLEALAADVAETERRRAAAAGE